MKPCVIFNPVARGEKAQQFRAQLSALAGSAVLMPTRSAGDGRALAAQAVRDGFTTVVAAGGDGTVNEVLNGIHDARGLERTRLGLLPLGTINVFARELGIPAEFTAAWQVIERAGERLVDAPSAEFVRAGAPVRQAFAQLAGAGLDSRAIELVDWEQKKLIGPLAYVAAGFKALAESHPRIQVRTPDRREDGELVLIGNGRYYGGSFVLFPRADLADGLLDVTIFPEVNWKVLLQAGWGWLTEQIHAAAGCHTLQAAEIALSAEQPVRFELDGDNIEPLPAKFSVQPRALRVLVP